MGKGLTAPKAEGMASKAIIEFKIINNFLILIFFLILCDHRVGCNLKGP